jgi:hypothetical protein
VNLAHKGLLHHRGRGEIHFLLSSENINDHFAMGSCAAALYEGVSKIFRTDAVKIINLITKRV